MVVKLIARDWIFWLIGALCTVSIGVAWLAKPTGPGTEGTAPLAGQARHASVAVPADDPVLQAVMNGTFPKVDSQLTLAEAFARYRWFSGPAKWLGKGSAASRTALVSAPLKLPADAVSLGVNSDAAQVFYVAEFGLSGDNKAFRPLMSAIEVRDASNKLIARIPDPEFILVRRVMRNVEPGASLKNGIAKGR